MVTLDILTALKPVVETLDKLSIPYYIGGSVASSIYGLPRATMDIDIVADIQNHHISSLEQILKNDYYVDENMIREAIKHNTSFNLIHLKTAIKIDIFTRKGDPYQENAKRRKRKDTLIEDEERTEFFFSSPEDIILAKLQWYEMGGRVSERQWLDVVGVIKIQGNLLDKNYLKDWSQKLGIIELLHKAYGDAGSQP